LVTSYFREHGVSGDRKTVHDAQMLRLRARLEREADVAFQADELALSVHMSVSQMNRRFRRAFGISPKGHWQKVRQTRIQYALRYSSLSLNEIVTTAAPGGLPCDGGSHSMTRIPFVCETAEQVRELLTAGFLRFGLSAWASAQVAEALVEAELWDRPTHGLMRVSGIVKALKGGLTGEPKIGREGPSYAQLDGAGCLGYVVSSRAVEVAVEKAGASGLAIVGARHSAHNGMLGYFAYRLTEAGLIGFAATHCRPSVAAFGASEGVLGTNPLALACPSPEPAGGPVLIDLATSAVTYGEMEHRRRQGTELSAGVALDAAGRPTEDPASAQAGFVLPFGSPNGEGKGSALGLLVELLSSLAVGAPPFPEVAGSYGHFFMAIRPGLLAGEESYRDGWEQVLKRFGVLRPRPGFPQPRLPGARAMAKRREALREGLRIAPALWAEVRSALGSR
jgi:LDH2 family malate/lactate/ureidoglycolate dehydrogenase/AraC-like DNA-binding protein